MSLTEINAINESYPVAGIDQSSQTFRDNFANIKVALTDLDSAVITVIDDVGDVDTTSTPPVADNVLTFDGANWVPGTVEIVKDTTPQLGGNLDVNGFNIGDGTNPILGFVEAGTPVNWLNVSNANTGNSPAIAAVGSDTNISLLLSSKGANPVVFDNDGGGTVSLTTLESSLSITVPSTSSANGRSVTVRAGDTTLTNGNGGVLNLRAGLHDGTGFRGSVNVQDAAGNRIIRFRQPLGATGVNHYDVASGALGSAPAISVAGTDANINFVVLPKGTGRFYVVNDGADTIRYPRDDGSAGYVMTTDGSGNLSLDTPSDLGEFTVAGLPDPTTHANAYALATDASGGRTIVRSDGTNWKVVAIEGATVTT